MTSPQLRVGAAAFGLLGFCAATILACVDTDAPTKPSRGANDTRVTVPTSIDAASVRAREFLLRQNAHDWVGVAHNRAIDDLRKAMSRPGILTRNVCDYLVDYIVRPERTPSRARALPIEARRQAARRGLAATGICRLQPQSRTTAWSAAEASAAIPQEPELSADASALLTTIQTAVETAANRYDLAIRLNEIQVAAGGLEATEQAIVAGSVSTAQHSFEYWETELPAFQQEFWNEYSTCAEVYKASGYTMDDARVTCLEGGIAETLVPSQHSPGLVPVTRMASYRLPAVCGLRTHFKRLVGSDVAGAIVGATKAAVFGPAGVVDGAIAGGSLASLGSFLKSTWDLFWCAM